MSCFQGAGVTGRIAADVARCFSPRPNALAARRRPERAFSLLEVVVAIGLVAVAVVALLGLLAATVHSAAGLGDAEGGASLGGSVQCELERLRDSHGLAGLAGLVPLAGSPAPLRLAGTRDGLRVRCLDAADPAADRSPSDPVLPGIAARNCWFLIELTRIKELDTSGDAGFLAVCARCSWPYKLPLGPAAPNASDGDADPPAEVPAAERQVMILLSGVAP